MILIAGATGVLGFEIVRRLIDRGEHVRALVRTSSTPGKVAALRTLGAETVEGDLKDRASLDAACGGVNKVLSTVTSIATAKPGDSFAATDQAGNMNLIDAAVAAGAEQFVFVSFDTDAALDAPLTAAKRAVEDHLRSSGIAFTILQPSLFMETWLGPMLFADTGAGTARVYGNGETGIRYISVADVAETAVQALASPAARNAVIPVGGPEAVSQRQAVKIFEQVFGKSFDVTEVPEGALEAQWQAADDPLQKTFSALMLGVARGFGSNIAPASDTFPMKMATVNDYANRLPR
jgi:uncharacterized protein YbjT (DUF2867 family)